MNAGVYSITTPSGRQYIGSAVNFSRRWRVHLCRMKQQKHDNAILQSAWNKHGDKLVFKKLIVCPPDQVLLYEQLAIDSLNPKMNICRIAGNTRGYQHTEETKSRFIDRRKSFGNAGKKHSIETREKISRKKKGRVSNRLNIPVSDEVKEKIRATLKGRVNTPEQIARQKAAFAATIARRRSEAARSDG